MNTNKKGKSPLVSIIVATYRREKELIEALNSITKMDYLNYEIVLVVP